MYHVPVFYFLLVDLEDAGLITHSKDKAIAIAGSLPAFRAGARDLIAKVKTAQFEGERKLKTVAAYATSLECRSVFIRRYFGEDNHRAAAPAIAAAKAQYRSWSRARRRLNESGDDAAGQNGGRHPLVLQAARSAKSKHRRHCAVVRPRMCGRGRPLSPIRA